MTGNETEEISCGINRRIASKASGHCQQRESLYTKIRHAQILIKLDETFNEKPWTIQQIKKAYRSNEHTICSIAQRFVEEGMESALNRKQQQNRRHKITGDVEAHIAATACSKASEGRDRWTLSVITDRLVHLHIIDSISPAAVGTTLKK